MKKKRFVALMMVFLSLLLVFNMTSAAAKKSKKNAEPTSVSELESESESVAGGGRTDGDEDEEKNPWPLLGIIVGVTLVAVGAGVLVIVLVNRNKKKNELGNLPEQPSVAGGVPGAVPGMAPNMPGMAPNMPGMTPNMPGMAPNETGVLRSNMAPPVQNGAPAPMVLSDPAGDNMMQMQTQAAEDVAAGAYGNMSLRDQLISDRTGSITGIAGVYRGASLSIRNGETVSIGRDPTLCNLVMTSDLVRISRLHCTVEYEGDEDVYIVTDLSRNGTFIKGGRLKHQVPATLHPGAEIQLANSSNIFRLG